MTHEKRIVNKELRAYFNDGARRIKVIEAQTDEDPFTLHRNFKQHFELSKEEKAGAYLWEEALKFR